MLDRLQARPGSRVRADAKHSKRVTGLRDPAGYSWSLSNWRVTYYGAALAVKGWLTCSPGESSVVGMRTKGLAWLLIIGFLSGCASLRIAGQVQAGRQALLMNNPEAALIHFQQAAQSDPNYRMRSGPFQEGVWTYVGRAQYHTGRLAEARHSLERALSLDKDDYLARLYLGLTLARGGDRAKGFKEIESGMKGLYDWFEYITYYTTSGQYWDPAREIESEIEKDLAMISGKDIDWPSLISSAEWVGRKVEEEVDLARRDERRRLRGRFRSRLGVSMGVGF